MNEMDDHIGVAQLGRRNALTKGVIAGAVVWSAPVVPSTTASAQDGSCTPKCRPQGAPLLTVATSVVCDDGFPQVVVNGTISVDLSPVTCGCGGEPVLDILVVGDEVGGSFSLVVDLSSGQRLNNLAGSVSFTARTEAATRAHERANSRCWWASPVQAATTSWWRAGRMFSAEQRVVPVGVCHL